MHFPIELPPDILSKAAELGVRPEDIEEHFTHSRGPGGQNVNKRSTAVQLHHMPTGTLVRSEEHRDQHQNRIAAYAHLILKLEEQAKGRESERARETYRVRKQKERRSRRAKQKMLDEKKQRGDIKEMRKGINNKEP
ncbi:MAG: peptide chain release factor [Candidatus Peregrinibacteria bacterium Greene0416_19]|nr:MAG: peptide chain release factor [Candidatus Peregrinibacteria bacterium Greene0416_19]